MAGEKVGIIGSGLIGRSWAMLFAAAGYNVTLFDIAQTQLDTAIDDIRQKLVELESRNLLRGKLSAKEQVALISTTDDLSKAVADAVHVQECVPENQALKNKVLNNISNACTSDTTIICSSTSTILPSKIFDGIPRVSQCIVAHPVNPPYFCPLTEIIPHPSTNADILKNTKEIMEKIGQVVVTVKQEVDGFVLNRIQYAIINESWRLVADGVMTPEDVDKVFTSGLGMRYAFMGPFETIHLNAEGVENYMERYASSIRRVSSDFGPIPTFDGKALETVHNAMSSTIPATPEGLAARRQWRDQRLIALSELKKKMD